MNLAEKYRPRALAEVVGQDKAVATIGRLIDRQAQGGRAYLFTGPSGAGKTTLARILAATLADPINVLEFDAIDATPARIGAIEVDWQYPGMGALTGRAWIVNEVHTMAPAAIGKWLTALERIPPHALVCFTTTLEGLAQFSDKTDARPFCSRCLHVPLTPRGIAKPFAARVQEIAQAEGLDGQEIARYIRLANEHRSNMRAMLQAVESGAMLAT